LGETSLEAHAAQEKTPLKFVTMSKSKPNAISQSRLSESKALKNNNLGGCLNQACCQGKGNFYAL